ncbi:jg19991 [Pararge aegeria aegeria]|uniref:Jg19991 protein n=1 Tax=Pararge aegeria aegeria TaxID=348720 RepID=A0A8S4R2R4_9NEOP|nr:jg19991 [Pararge aegeria aegeria]
MSLALTAKENILRKPVCLRVLHNVFKGAGVYCPELNINIAQAVGENYSVFRAECVGVTTAATAMLNRKLSGFNININSDSQAVLKALAKYMTSSKILKDCHSTLKTLKKPNRVTLRWIRGHNGNMGNDAADKLARLATSLKMVGLEPIIPIPFGEYKTLLHKQTFEHNLTTLSVNTQRRP